MVGGDCVLGQSLGVGEPRLRSHVQPQGWELLFGKTERQTLTYRRKDACPLPSQTGLREDAGTGGGPPPGEAAAGATRMAGNVVRSQHFQGAARASPTRQPLKLISRPPACLEGGLLLLGPCGPHWWRLIRDSPGGPHISRHEDSHCPQGPVSLLWPPGPSVSTAQMVAPCQGALSSKPSSPLKQGTSARCV